MASTKKCSSTDTGLGCSPLSSMLAESSTLSILGGDWKTSGEDVDGCS